MLNAENTDAKLLVEIEQLKGSNTANIEYINSLKKLHNERDDNVKKLNIELSSLKNSTLMRKRKIDSLTNKLNDLLANTKVRNIIRKILLLTWRNLMLKIDLGLKIYTNLSIQNF